MEFGVERSLLTKKSIANICQSCLKGSISIAIYQKYFYVMWIPFMPMEKTAESQCKFCKNTLLEKEFTNDLLSISKSIKENLKTPIWTYVGLIIPTVFAIIIFISNMMEGPSTKEMIETSQKGDIYEIKEKSKRYTLYKVDKVIGNEIFMFKSKFVTDKITGLKLPQFSKDDAYDIDEYLILEKYFLIKMLEQKNIFKIHRRNRKNK